MSAQSVPEGSHSITPYLVVDDGAGAIDFYGRAFGAELLMRMDMPDGKVGHASLQIGDSRIMLADVFPGGPYRPPKETGAPGTGLYLYVDDVDAAFQRAVDAGATPQSKPDDMFWGDRWSRVVDPFGHIWELATHVEDVDADEMAERAKAAMVGMG
jgi:PhnB protein